MALFKKKPKKGDGPAAEGEAAEAPAGAEGEEGAADDGGKKKLPIKLMVIALAGLLVLGGGGAGAFFMFGPKPAAEHGEGKDAHGKDKGKHDKKKKDDKKKGGHGEGGEAAPGQPAISEGPDGVVFYKLPEIVVNMQTADGKPTYLKLGLILELPDHETADALEPNRARMNDMFQTFLRELRPEDLAGSQGSYQLKMEIQRRVNLVIAPAKINAVLIDGMLIN